MRAEIYLTAYDPSQASDLFALTEKNRCMLRKWVDWIDRVQTVEDSRAFIHRQISNKHYVNFFIHHDSAMIGTVGVVGVGECGTTAEIGYWLDEGMHGQGIMTWAVQKLIEEMRKRCERLKVVVLKCWDVNKGSQRVAEKCGFQYVETVKDDVERNGLVHFTRVYHYVIDK